MSHFSAPESASLDSNSRHVVVVGAGIVGASVAAELSRRGARVTVLEAEEPTAGATGRSFAWIAGQAFFRAKDPIPESQARDYFDLHRLGLDAWRRLDRELGAQLGVRWHGVVQWATEDGEATRLAEELHRRQRWGSPSYRITTAELAARVPDAVLDEVRFAFVGPDEATVDPFAAVRALLDVAIVRGTEVRTQCRVEGFSTLPDGRVAVRHTEGETVCDDVVIACGRATPEIAATVGIDVPLLETRGQLVHLSPQEMFLGPLVLGPSVHAVQRSDGRVVLGRHFTGSPVTDAPGFDAEALLTDAVAVFPRLADATLERVTDGRRILPSDGLPIIGRAPQLPSVRAIACNAGITLGPLLARLLVTEILDGVEVDILDRYRADRFALQS